MAIGLDMACDLGDFCGRDERQRYYMGGILYDDDAHAVVATNGVLLAIVPLPGSALGKTPTEDAIIDPLVFRTPLARDGARLSFRNGQATITTPSCGAAEDFPPWRTTLPAAHGNTPQVLVDAALLSKVLDYATQRGAREMRIAIDPASPGDPLEVIIRLRDGRDAHFILATMDSEGDVARAAEKWPQVTDATVEGATG